MTDEPNEAGDSELAKMIRAVVADAMKGARLAIQRWEDVIWYGSGAPEVEERHKERMRAAGLGEE